MVTASDCTVESLVAWNGMEKILQGNAKVVQKNKFPLQPFGGPEITYRLLSFKYRTAVSLEKLVVIFFYYCYSIEFFIIFIHFKNFDSFIHKLCIWFYGYYRPLIIIQIQIMINE